MLDGWQVRQRGPGWGKKKTSEPRVEWHEWKTGVYYRHEQSAVTAGGRGVLAEKVVVGWQGDPVEFGARLHWEAQRGGLSRARATLAGIDYSKESAKAIRDSRAAATTRAKAMDRVAKVLPYLHTTKSAAEMCRLAEISKKTYENWLRSGLIERHPNGRVC